MRARAAKPVHPRHSQNMICFPKKVEKCLPLCYTFYNLKVRPKQLGQSIFIRQQIQSVYCLDFDKKRKNGDVFFLEK